MIRWILLFLPPVSLAGALLLPRQAAEFSLFLAAASAALAMDSLLRPLSRLLGTGIRRTQRRDRVALTFDDGPHPVDTPAILEILDRAGVRATFFFVGKKARAYPHLVRQAAASGHEVESHSDTHPWWFSLAGPGRTRREIQGASRALEELSGRRVRFFRPPMGHRTFFLEGSLAEAGLELVLWSRRPFDTLPVSPERIRKRVVASAAPGEILGLHEGVGRAPGSPSRTVAALPAILRGLRERGLEPAPLGALRDAS